MVLHNLGLLQVQIPSNPPINTVSENISSMVATGRFSLGVECATYTLTKYKFVDGTMTSILCQIGN